MYQQQLLRILSKTALFAVITTVTACSYVEGTYNDVMGNESKSAPKVTVKSPGAAPFQDVKAVETTPQKPVELGSMSDPSLAAPKIVPQPAVIEPSTPGMAPDMPQDMTAQAMAPKTLVLQEGAAPKIIQGDASTAQQQAAAQNTLPTPPQVPAAAPTPAAANTVALLTVRFNQPHVYYEDALVRAVTDAEKAKPGVMYDVLSTIPDLSSLPPEQQAKMTQRAKDNLRNIVLKMQQVGVSADRIRIADQTLKIRSQEIRIFVR